MLDVDVQAPPARNSYANAAELDPRRPPAVLLAAPGRPAGRRAAVVLGVAGVRRYEMHLNHAGGWWPNGATYRDAASWLPAPSLRFDDYVDHLCRTWLGRPADARLQNAADQAVTGPKWAVVTAVDGDHQRARLASWLFPRLADRPCSTPPTT